MGGWDCTHDRRRVGGVVMAVVDDQTSSAATGDGGGLRKARRRKKVTQEEEVATSYTPTAQELANAKLNPLLHGQDLYTAQGRPRVQTQIR